MEKRDFNLFLLVMCLIALPLYAAGAVMESLLEGGQKALPAFRPSRRSVTRLSSVSVCLCCGSWQVNR
jgi:hypothetical protein